MCGDELTVSNHSQGPTHTKKKRSPSATAALENALSVGRLEWSLHNNWLTHSQNENT